MPKITTRRELFDRIQKLPAAQRERATLLAISIYAKRGAIPEVPRDPSLIRLPEDRRKFAGDPWRYFGDVLGWRLTPQQERVLDEVERFDRLLVASANNLGKTWFLGGYGVYRMDAIAALVDAENDLEEQGCRVLLPGPDHNTIKQTVYAKMLIHAARAERRGFIMPGYRSANSVLWRVRPEWAVEAFSPPKRADQAVSHQASGRHHANQVALIEEGQGVAEALWLAVEGMCSGTGNKIISSFNPTESAGPTFERSRAGGWRVIHLSAFDHPNVRSRAVVVPGAIGHLVIDTRVREHAKDRGAFPETRVDEKHRDFVYALPPGIGHPEKGAREDGQLGHPDGVLRVYRPDAWFEAGVLGQWPRAFDNRLFSAAAWDEGVDRWRAGHDPNSPPDRVGADIARSKGGDDICGAPAWGPAAENLLRAYAAAVEDGEEEVLRLRREARIRVGTIQLLAPGDGTDVAQQYVKRWPNSPFVVDEGGVGASVLDHLVRVIGAEAIGVSFGGHPPDPTPGESWSENMRTAMYLRAALLSNAGLLDPPDDPLLRQEMLAQEVVIRYRSVEVIDDATRQKRKERKPSFLLVDKAHVKKLIGRSPDRADAFVLSLTEAEPQRKKLVFTL